MSRGRRNRPRGWGLQVATPQSLNRPADQGQVEAAQSITQAQSAAKDQASELSHRDVPPGPLPDAQLRFRTPSEIATELAYRRQNMDSSRYPSPGVPLPTILPPGHRPTMWQFPVAYNTYALPRAYEGATFANMTQAVYSTSLPQRCIWLRTEAATQLDTVCDVAPGLDNRSGIYNDDIKACQRRLDDLELTAGYSFTDINRMLAQQAVAYDCPTLYLDRDRAGRVGAPWPIDGRTVALLIDGNGNRPFGDAEVAIQWYNGAPLVPIWAPDLIYHPQRQALGSMYGSPPIESAFLDIACMSALTYWMARTMSKGHRPKVILHAPESVTATAEKTVAQVLGDLEEDFSLGWENTGNEFTWAPFGTTTTLIPDSKFDVAYYKLLQDTLTVHYSVQPMVAGNTDNTNRSTSETQFRVQKEQGTRPLALFVIKRAWDTFLARCGYPHIKLKFLNIESEEDQLALANRDAVLQKAYIKSPRISAQERGIQSGPENPIPYFVLARGETLYVPRSEVAGLDLVAFGSTMKDGAYETQQGLIKGPDAIDTQVGGTNTPHQLDDNDHGVTP